MRERKRMEKRRHLGMVLKCEEEFGMGEGSLR